MAVKQSAPARHGPDAPLPERGGSPPARLPRNVVLIALTSLCADLSSEMAYPLLPLFLTETLRAPASAVGLVEGVAEATQHGVQALSGSAADRLPRKRPLAALGYALTAAGKPLIGAATGWPLALAGRAVDRLGAGTRSAPRDALIANSVGEDARGRAFGLEGIGDNAGAFLGPLLALLLVAVAGVSYRAVILLAVVPGLAALGLILAVREPRDAAAPAPLARAAALPFAPAYWRYLGVTALFGLGNSTNAFLVLRLRDAGVPFAQTLLIYAGFNLVAALASYPAGAAADRLGRKPLLLGSWLVFALVYAGFAAGAGPLLLAPLFVGYGAYQGAYRAVGKSYAADLAPATRRAAGIGWYAATMGLTGLVASILGGWLWTAVSPVATFALGVAGALAAALALALFLREPPHREE